MSSVAGFGRLLLDENRAHPRCTPLAKAVVVAVAAVVLLGAGVGVGFAAYSAGGGTAGRQAAIAVGQSSTSSDACFVRSLDGGASWQDGVSGRLPHPYQVSANVQPVAAIDSFVVASQTDGGNGAYAVLAAPAWSTSTSTTQWHVLLRPDQLPECGDFAVPPDLSSAPGGRVGAVACRASIYVTTDGFRSMHAPVVMTDSPDVRGVMDVCWVNDTHAIATLLADGLVTYYTTTNDTGTSWSPVRTEPTWRCGSTGAGAAYLLGDFARGWGLLDPFHNRTHYGANVKQLFGAYAFRPTFGFGVPQIDSGDVGAFTHNYRTFYTTSLPPGAVSGYAWLNADASLAFVDGYYAPTASFTAGDPGATQWAPSPLKNVDCTSLLLAFWEQP